MSINAKSGERDPFIPELYLTSAQRKNLIGYATGKGEKREGRRDAPGGKVEYFRVIGT